MSVEMFFFYILFVYGVNSSSLPKSASCGKELEKIMTVVSEINTKVEELNTKIAEQNTKIAEQDTTIAEQDTKMAEQETLIFKLKLSVLKYTEDKKRNETSKPSTVQGTTFIRYGRDDCPANVSQKVYSGTVGGSHYTHKGAATNHLCLPTDPQWNNNKHYNGPYWGYVYGSEYEEVPQSHLKDKSVPCAVCETSYSKQIMLPARTTCYPGWQEAYSGEMSSGYYNHAAATEYVCLDKVPKDVGSSTNENGILFYPVRAACGSLPCPPYIDSTLLTCVVCLK